MPEPGASQPTLIGSVQRAVRLVDEVAATDRPVTAKALARRTGQQLSTTYHLLRTLVHEGYLRRVEGGGYVLGDHLLALPRGRAQLLASRVRPTLRMLHEELGAAAYLSFYEDGEVRLVDVVDSPAAPRVDLWVGFGDAGHATALGKCVLACLSDAERNDYLGRHELNDLTPHTVTDRRVLLDRLRADLGWAMDREEYAVGTICVAAPIVVPRLGEDDQGGLTGAVAVSLPVRRSSRVEDSRRPLGRAAHRIGLALATA